MPTKPCALNVKCGRPLATAIASDFSGRRSATALPYRVHGEMLTGSEAVVHLAALIPKVADPDISHRWSQPPAVTGRISKAGAPSSGRRARK